MALKLDSGLLQDYANPAVDDGTASLKAQEMWMSFINTHEDNKRADAQLELDKQKWEVDKESKLLSQESQRLENEKAGIELGEFKEDTPNRKETKRLELEKKREDLIQSRLNNKLDKAEYDYILETLDSRIEKTKLDVEVAQTSIAANRASTEASALRSDLNQLELEERRATSTSRVAAEDAEAVARTQSAKSKAALAQVTKALSQGGIDSYMSAMRQYGSELSGDDMSAANNLLVQQGDNGKKQLLTAFSAAITGDDELAEAIVASRYGVSPDMIVVDGKGSSLRDGILTIKRLDTGAKEDIPVMQLLDEKQQIDITWQGIQADGNAKAHEARMVKERNSLVINELNRRSDEQAERMDVKMDTPTEDELKNAWIMWNAIDPAAAASYAGQDSAGDRTAALTVAVKSAKLALIDDSRQGDGTLSAEQALRDALIGVQQASSTARTEDGIIDSIANNFFGANRRSGSTTTIAPQPTRPGRSSELPEGVIDPAPNADPRRGGSVAKRQEAVAQEGARPKHSGGPQARYEELKAAGYDEDEISSIMTKQGYKRR